MRYLLFVIFSLFSFSISASTFPTEPYISVTGNASLEVEADQVMITFQAYAIEENGEQAKETVDQKIASLLKNLKKSGFKSDYLETISQSSRPEYDFQKNQRSLLGIRVIHRLRYRLTDISRVNDFLNAVFSAQIESISAFKYGLQNPQQWQGKVRKIAVLDSKQKAQDLAHLYGAKLGNVYSITYTNNYSQPVLNRAMEMTSDTVDIKPQNILLKDRVNTVFMLLPVSN
ncbi:MAG: SIMPL domain-containing protein [Psychromonas sp.]